MNAPTFTSSLAVLGGRTSPATIRVEVVDGEADAATVEFSYRLPGADADTVITTLAANPAVLTTAKAGVAHELLWDFAAEPGLAGAGYRPGVLVSARLVGGSTQAVAIDLGNDPAVVQFSTPTGEADGIVPIPCSVSDSSSDVVSVKVEYRVEGEGTTDWAVARPGGLDPADPTPALAIVGLQATVAGSPTVFFWDTEADLPGFERDVRLRFTVSDGVGESGSVESAVFRVDNNAAPFLTIDEGAVIEAADGIRGVPVPFHIADPEGDLVRVLFQWSRPGQPPPALGTTDPAALHRLVLDPAERRRKQICSPYRSITSGQPIPVDGLQVRLPEIAGAGHAWIWQRGFEGLELELLRPPAGAAELLTATWPVNPLRRPVATLPSPLGDRALVLDDLGNGSAALLEVDLSSGTVVRGLANGILGVPGAMCQTADGFGTLVATDQGGTWVLFEIPTSTGLPVERLRASSSGPAGVVRGVVAVGPAAALVTVGSRIVRVDWSNNSSPRAATLVAGLAEPWGLALDPLREGRVYVAERAYAASTGVGRVASFDLASHTLETLGANGSLHRFPQPTALTVRGDGTQLVVLCQPPASVAPQAHWYHLGMPASQASNIVVAPVGTTSLAGGPDFLTLFALPDTGALAAVGGVRQVRQIASFDGMTSTATVTQPFAPPPQETDTWRLRAIDPFLHPLRATAGGSAGIFVWDSREVPGGGEVILNATCVDTDAGNATASTGALVLEHALAAPAQNLPGSAAIVTDIDGDGAADLACQPVGGSVGIFLQLPAGGYSVSPTWSIAETTAPLACGDLNGDGRVDLVFANGTAMRIYRQLAGGGGFPSSPSQTLTSSTNWVTIVDLNGDGRNDLLSAGGYRLQTAPGAFAAPTVVGPLSGGPAIPLDVGQDGLIDFIISPFAASGVTLVLQTAPLVFTAAGTFGGGIFFLAGTAVSDLDGDGWEELAVAFSSGTAPAEDKLMIWRGTPLGFGVSTTIGGFANQGTIVRPTGLAVGDLDRDRRPDLVVTGQFGQSTTVLHGDASGSFLVRRVAALGAPLHLADLDLDGRVDILGQGAMIHCASPRLRSTSSSVVATPQYPSRVSKVAAFEPNGALPALATTDVDQVFEGGFVLRSVQQRRGVFDPNPPSESYRSLAYISALAGADFDGDGRADLLVATSPIYSGGSGSLGGVASPQMLETEHIAYGDLDGDGDLDLVTANRLTNNVGVFRHGPGTTLNAPLFLGGSTTTPNCSLVRVADLDTDGRFDLVAGSAVFYQSATGTFDPSPSLQLSGGTSCAADLNGDGRVDLVGAGGFFFQRANGSLGTSPDRAGFAAFEVADLDGNGLVDLLGGTAVAFQLTPGYFVSQAMSLGGVNVVLDLDVDGDLDLVAARPTTVLWRGR